MFRKILIRLNLLPPPWNPPTHIEPTWPKMWHENVLFNEGDLNKLSAILAAYADVGFNADDIMGLLVRPCSSLEFPHRERFAEAVIYHNTYEWPNNEEVTMMQRQHAQMARQSRLTQWL